MINVNKINSRSKKNIHLQLLNVYYTVPSFVFDKKMSKLTIERNAII